MLAGSSLPSGRVACYQFISYGYGRNEYAAVPGRKFSNCLNCNYASNW